MKTILHPLLATLAGLLRSRAVLHLEILALRQQLAMVAHSDRKLRFRRRERLFWIWLYRVWPGCLETLVVFKADTLVRWHRQGFRLYWCCDTNAARSNRLNAERWLLSLTSAVFITSTDAPPEAIPLPTTLPDTALSLKCKHEIGDALQANPERFRAWESIAFAVEEAAEAGDHAHHGIE